METADFEAFVGRIIRAFGRRVGDGDVEGLRALSEAGERVDRALHDAVAQLRADPWNYSWGDIARVLGVTRQAAWERFSDCTQGVES